MIEQYAANDMNNDVDKMKTSNIVLVEIVVQRKTDHDNGATGR